MKAVIALVLILLALIAFVLWMRYGEPGKTNSEAWSQIEQTRAEGDARVALEFDESDRTADLCQPRNYQYKP